MSLTGFLDFSAGRRRSSPIPPHGEGFVGLDDFYVREIGLEGCEVCVAFVGFVDVADQPFVNLWGEGVVDFRTTDGEDFLIGSRNLGGAVDDIDTVMRPLAIAGEDDVTAFW